MTRSLLLRAGLLAALVLTSTLIRAAEPARIDENLPRALRGLPPPPKSAE